MILPTLRQLQFLSAIAEHGSFSRAAEACHVTQPTLSAGIKELEAIMGVQLVEREARGARMSAAGEIAAQRAKRLLTDVQDLSAAVQLASAPLSGTFRLGAIPTIAPFVLPATISSLREHYPDLDLRLREDLTERLLDDVRNRNLDAALIGLPFDSAGIETMALADDEFLFVGPEGHRLAAKNGLSPSDLLDEKLLLLEDGHCLRDHSLSVCGRPAVQDGAQIAATSLHTLVQMVAAGLGVTMLPKLAATSGLMTGTRLAVRAFADPVIGRTIGIAWRTGASCERDARLIGEIVRQALSQG